jgi:AcrR family transcriptional regulator
MDYETPERPDFAAWRRSLRENDPALADDEGLRERKKRLTKAMISGTASLMFVQRGFDNVKITEVAAACGVSEKTIYNYFPTKESLVLDWEDEFTEMIERSLGPGTTQSSPVEAMKEFITKQTRDLVSSLKRTHQSDLAMIRSFTDMINETPSLRAKQFDITENLSQVAAHAMALRAGLDPEDPEPQIAADALLGLCRVYYRTIAKYAATELTPDAFEQRVLAEVDRAGRLIDTGLWSFAMTVQGTDSRDQLRVAADASNEARKQVIRALREAKAAWLQVRTDVSTHANGAHRRSGVQDQKEAARRSAQEVRAQAQDLRREVRKVKQELRDEIRQQTKKAKRTVREK